MHSCLLLAKANLLTQKKTRFIAALTYLSPIIFAPPLHTDNS